tara:strand:- start:3935 stop:4924 length:990 start_codon:yes stop_codon:yes gene_type:complete
MIYQFLIFTLLLSYSIAFTSFFSNWHCIGINPDLSKPYRFKVGDLPLVAWKNNNSLCSTINICRHLGSKLDKGKIINGNLHCPYHNLKHDENYNFGIIRQFQDKLWWSYNPTLPHPPKIPFYKKDGFHIQHLECIMNTGLKDCAYNSMDLNHPEFVHKGMFGFGSNIPPKNVKTLKYKDRVGMTFDYHLKENIASFSKKKNNTISKNFNMFIYPNNAWSKVSFDSNILIVYIHMLPISHTKTKWFVSINHNFNTDNFLEMQILKMSTKMILDQDSDQFDKMMKDSSLKDEITFQKMLKYDESIEHVKKLLKKYKYPNVKICTEFIKMIV